MGVCPWRDTSPSLPRVPYIERTLGSHKTEARRKIGVCEWNGQICPCTRRDGDTGNHSGSYGLGTDERLDRRFTSIRTPLRLALHCGTFCRCESPGPTGYRLHNHAPIETDEPRQAQKSSGYALLVCVWALAECTRYPYYALLYLSQSKGPTTSIGRLTALFQYLRYTTFILLYPLGVGGAELTLFRKKLPPLDKLKAASTREKLDTGIVFLALLAWPKGMLTHA